MKKLYLVFGIIAIFAAVTLVSLGCGALLKNDNVNDVQTTVQRTILPGVIPSTMINLYELASYEALGYGNWTYGPGLPYDKRLDIMPNSYNGSAVTHKSKLLNFFTISDIHITDKEAPNQLIYVSRFHKSSPFSVSIYSGSMLSTTQLLDAAVQTVNALHKQNSFDFGLSLGDTINSASYKELRWYIDVLDGKDIVPSSGAHLGAGTIDYQMPFKAAGLDKSIPWYQTLGNHDHFWMGSFPISNALSQTYITGNVFKMTDPLANPPSGVKYYMGVIDGSTPYGNIICAGPTSEFSVAPTVEADPDRRALQKAEWISEFSNTSSSPVGHGFNLVDVANGADFACYSFVPKSTIPLKVIVLDDTQNDNDGSSDIHGHAFLDTARWEWLKHELAAGDSADQLMIIAAHIPISVEAANSQMSWWANSQNAVSLEGLVSELQSHPNLLMWLSGHRHLNAVKAFISPDPVSAPEKGFWEVETPSLKDYPQQFRTFELYLNSDYSISIFATDVDPVVIDGTPAAKSRKYAIGAAQIVGSTYSNYITRNNPTNDPTIKEMPTGSYNAELVKKLSPEMIAKMHTL